MCAVSYREVNEVARRIDADITVVSLEPTSIEGILNTITTVGAMAEVEDAAIDLVEALRERLAAVERDGRDPSRGRSATRRGSSRSSGSTRRSRSVTGCRSRSGGPAAGTCSARTATRPSATTWDAVAEVDPEMLFLMPCGFHLAETVREWATVDKPVWLPDLPAVRRGAVFAVDGSAYFSRPGPRVIDGIELLAEIIDPAAFVDIAPPGGWTPVPVWPERRMPFRATFACLWCGTAHTCRGPDDLEGWAQLCPDCVGKAGDNGFLRFRLRQALDGASGPHARGHGNGRRSPRSPAAPATAAPTSRLGRRRRSTTSMVDYYEARAREYDDWYLRRGRYARGAIHDAAWHAELDAAGRWLDGLPLAGGSSSSPPGTGWWSPLLAVEGRAVAVRRDGRAARSGPRAPASRTTCARTSTSATPGPSRIGPVDGLFTGFWLSHVRARPAAPRSWPSRGAGSSPAVGSPSSTRCRTRHPARPTIRPRPTTGRVRRLDDGREFTIVKVFYTPDELAAALAAAGFERRRGRRRPAASSCSATARAACTRRPRPQTPEVRRSLYSAPMSPLSNATIATVGSGVMAEAMIAGLLRGAARRSPARSSPATREPNVARPSSASTASGR